MWKVGFYLLQRGASDNTMIRLCTNPRSDVIQDRRAIENTASSPGTKSLHRNGKKRCWSSKKIFLCPTFHHSKPIYIYIYYIYTRKLDLWFERYTSLKGQEHCRCQFTPWDHDISLTPQCWISRMPRPSPTLCNMWALLAFCKQATASSWHTPEDLGMSTLCHHSVEAEDMHGGKIQKIERDGLVAILWNTSVDMFVDEILLVDVTFMSVIFGETVWHCFFLIVEVLLESWCQSWSFRHLFESMQKNVSISEVFLWPYTVVCWKGWTIFHETRRL